MSLRLPRFFQRQLLYVSLVIHSAPVNRPVLQIAEQIPSPSVQDPFPREQGIVRPVEGSPIHRGVVERNSVMRIRVEEKRKKRRMVAVQGLEPRTCLL